VAFQEHISWTPPTGHGGPHTATYLSQKLLPEILKAIPPHTPRDDIHQKLQALFNEFDADILSSFTENFKITLKIPIEGIRKKIISKKLSEDGIRDTVERAKSGSTALAAYVEGSMLCLANTGDCRAGRFISPPSNKINQY
jgi:serine/threonine protein phosphatase PrpC